VNKAKKGKVQPSFSAVSAIGAKATSDPQRGAAARQFDSGPLTDRSQTSGSDATGALHNGGVGLPVGTATFADNVVR